ncbi:MAG: HDOD domain-containing protein [Treponema sp.]|nr:HDOD domain-containing protein [Treponema sp.]
MTNSENELESVDIEKIRQAIKLHTPIEITTYTLPRNMEIYIQQIMDTFLTECHQTHMIGFLNFCLDELLTNSKKANTKRIYFKQHNLDLNDTEDYEKGMKTFKEDTLNNIDYYLTEQKKAGLYIKFEIQLIEDFIKIEIKNNALLCPMEEDRIREKLKSAENYSTERDALERLLDQTEGAGLGIIIIILMLQKIGLTIENYKVFTTDTDTVTQIILPLNTEVKTGIETACLECVKTQTEIPVLEEALEELTQELSKPVLNKKKITALISKDVTFTCLLLKHASVKESNCSKISTALEIIGFENLKKIYTKNNAELRVIKTAEDKNGRWEQAHSIAFYAYNLAKNFNIETDFDDEEIYLIGLLHNLENLLLETATPEQKKILMSSIQEKGITEKDFNLLHYEHCCSAAECLIGKAWGLPKKLTDLALCINHIEKASEGGNKLAYLLYLAEMMQHYKNREMEFYQIDEYICKMFEIDSEEKLNLIINRLEKAL